MDLARGILVTVFSIYAWTVWLLFLVIFGLPVVLVAMTCPRAWTFHTARGLIRPMFWLTGIRVRGEVSPRLDRARAHVYMANHVNFLDPFTLVLTIPQVAVGLEKQENFRIPIYGALIRHYGNVPIKREDPVQARESVRQLGERLSEGTSVMILPEGTRTKDGRLGPFKKGGFHLALGAGEAIVPVAIQGAYRVFRTGSWRVRPGTITVSFLDPVETAGASLEALMGEVRGAIAARLDEPIRTRETELG